MKRSGGRSSTQNVNQYELPVLKLLNSNCVEHYLTFTMTLLPCYMIQITSINDHLVVVLFAATYVYINNDNNNNNNNNSNIRKTTP